MNINREEKLSCVREKPVDLDSFEYITRFLGLKCSDFRIIFFLRYVCSLAFQCCISNCSTVKICTAKIVREVENDGEYCMEREAGEGDQLILRLNP